MLRSGPEWRLFPRSPEGARTAREWVAKSIAGRLRASELADFRVAVGEALANSLEHGGGSSIAVAVGVERGKVVATIEDAGPGFVLDGKPHLPRDLAVRGYGLFLMYALTDDFQILNDGRTIRLAIRARSGSAKSTPDDRRAV